MSRSLGMAFDPVQTVVLFMVLLVKFVIEDGRSHYLTGVVLVAVHTLVVVWFWDVLESGVLIQGVNVGCGACIKNVMFCRSLHINQNRHHFYSFLNLPLPATYRCLHFTLATLSLSSQCDSVSLYPSTLRPIIIIIIIFPSQTITEK